MQSLSVSSQRADEDPSSNDNAWCVCPDPSANANTPGTEIPVEPLSATRPRPSNSPSEPIHQPPEVVGIEIVSTTGVFEHRGHTMPTKFTGRILCSDGQMKTHHFTVLSTGRHRVAYTIHALPWVTKIQVLEGRRNQNKEEWDQVCNMSKLRFVVPTTHGYAQARIGHKDMSFLFMQQVGYTFTDLVTRMSTHELTRVTMSVVMVAVLTVVSTIVRSSHDCSRVYDWHSRNVAFEDHDVIVSAKLIKWAKNRSARTHESLPGRMHDAFVQFTSSFSDSPAWDYDRKNANVARMWDGFMKSMHQALNEWWCPWKWNLTGQDGDTQPGDAEMNQLSSVLMEVVDWTLSSKAEVGLTTERKLQKLFWYLARPQKRKAVTAFGSADGSLARESQSEESSVPTTVSRPSLPVTRVTTLVRPADSRQPKPSSRPTFSLDETAQTTLEQSEGGYSPQAANPSPGSSSATYSPHRRRRERSSRVRHCRLSRQG